jgi:hypothetical protein
LGGSARPTVSPIVICGVDLRHWAGPNASLCESSRARARVSREPLNVQDPTTPFTDILWKRLR